MFRIAVLGGYTVEDLDGMGDRGPRVKKGENGSKSNTKV